MFRRLFGGGSKDPPPRQPDHAWELGPGDFVKFGFTAPDGLKAVEAQVTGVAALDLGGAGRVRRVLTLDVPGGGTVTLWRGGDGRIALGREVLREMVEELFDLAIFSQLFDPDVPPQIVLERKAEPDGFERWTGALYRQEAAQQAYRHDDDPDTALILETRTSDAVELDFYRLVSDDRRHAVEVQVYDGGRTDVTLVAELPESTVEEMWSA